MFEGESSEGVMIRAWIFDGFLIILFLAHWGPWSSALDVRASGLAHLRWLSRTLPHSVGLTSWGSVYGDVGPRLSGPIRRQMNDHNVWPGHKIRVVKLHSVSFFLFRLRFLVVFGCLFYFSIRVTRRPLSHSREWHRDDSARDSSNQLVPAVSFYEFFFQSLGDK